MKKRLQLVALLLTLALSAQPLLADNACGQHACGHHPAMDCCPPSGNSSMPMGMDCAQSHPSASAPMRCAGDACCMLSPATAPALLPPAVLSPADGAAPIPPAALLTPAATYSLKRPPGPPLLLPARRYLLFRDLRI